jgi:hypothetical protein
MSQRKPKPEAPPRAVDATPPPTPREHSVPADFGLANEQLVGRNGDDITVLAPQTQMGRLEALRHAAWIVAVADDGSDDDFQEILERVRGI